jgi:hypothetical protein
MIAMFDGTSRPAKKDADIGTSLDSPANQVSGVNGAPQVRPAQRDAKHR